VRGFVEQDYGYASAVAVVLFIGIMIVAAPVLRGLVQRFRD
jgi:ABC-type sugar transport system permease subunit